VGTLTFIISIRRGSLVFSHAIHAAFVLFVAKMFSCSDFEFPTYLGNQCLF
jgi:hypothetical protein